MGRMVVGDVIGIPARRRGLLGPSTAASLYRAAFATAAKKRGRSAAPSSLPPRSPTTHHGHQRVPPLVDAKFGMGQRAAGWHGGDTVPFDIFGCTRALALLGSPLTMAAVSRLLRTDAPTWVSSETTSSGGAASSRTATCASWVSGRPGPRRGRGCQGGKGRGRRGVGNGGHRWMEAW